MNTSEDMSGRVNVVLPDEIYELLKELAETERRSQSQTAALLIEEALIARNLIKNTSAILKGKNDDRKTLPSEQKENT
jgi:predicted transcriptional regulator